VQQADWELDMVISEVPEATARRGPYAKSAQTRLTILDAALEVFAQSGYRSGSLRNVAERVGMSEAGLLHHFPSKSALLAAVLEHRDDHSRELYDFYSVPGRQRIKNLISLAGYNATIPGVVELFTHLAAEATAADHPAHEYFVERYKVTVALLREALEDMAGRGELVPGVDPAAAAQRSIALWDGLQIQWLLDRHSLDMSVQLKASFDMLAVEPF
jgi:AcrR family transcriptional regulator